MFIGGPVYQQTRRKCQLRWIWAAQHWHAFKGAHYKVQQEWKVAEWRLLRKLENDQSRLHDEAQLGDGEKRKWKAAFPCKKTLPDAWTAKQKARLLPVTLWPELRDQKSAFLHDTKPDAKRGGSNKSNLKVQKNNTLAGNKPRGSLCTVSPQLTWQPSLRWPLCSAPVSYPLAGTVWVFSILCHRSPYLYRDFTLHGFGNR